MNNTEVTRQRKINIYNIINEERYRTLNIYIYICIILIIKLILINLIIKLINNNKIYK